MACFRVSFGCGAMPLTLVIVAFVILPRIAASFSSRNMNSNMPAPVKNVVVVGGTHGNEYTGVWCIKALDRKRDELKLTFPSLEISTLLGNPEAFYANKRFINEDLNRAFSYEALHGRKETEELYLDDMTIEARRAQEIDQIIGPKFIGDSDHCDVDYNEDGSLCRPAADVVIDLHTTTTNMGVTIIIAEGDVLMTRAAAYILKKCRGIEARCLVHTHPNRYVRPNLSSAGTHGITIEVGPCPQGVLRHDVVEKTQEALQACLQFLQRHNQEPDDVHSELEAIYANGGDCHVPCFRSARAKRKGEMSGKIVWPVDPDNENFPLYLVHKRWQDRDFDLLHEGDPLFVDIEGNEILYDGSHGSPVHLIFVNEGGYYYSSSGTGIGVAVADKFDLFTGMLPPEAHQKEAQNDEVNEEEEDFSDLE